MVCFRVLVCLLFFMDSFGTFFRRPSPACSTLVLLSSFSCCLLFQLTDFLLTHSLTSIFSSWSRSLYVFGFCWCYGRFTALLDRMSPVARVLSLFGSNSKISKTRLATWILGGLYLIYNWSLTTWRSLWCKRGGICSCPFFWCTSKDKKYR